jgi:propanol-preferring alcohol dehydrogenase
VKALQYHAVGEEPELTDVPLPEPGPGQVRIKVTAAGACHSDVFVMSLPKEQLAQFGYPLPMTLGHEGAGVVDKLGDGVTGLQAGSPVAVYGPQGCGRCYLCAQGKENYCTEAAALGIFPPGLGAPGAMAEYLIVPDARHLIPLGDLDPVANVALTDAGLTPYHAIKGSVPKLLPGSTAVVIGTGGLGHVAVQILTALTPARVIALDVSEEKLQLARDVGAHHSVLSDADAAAAVREITGPRGATAVFDFVVNQPTIDLGAALLGAESDLVLVGVGAGQASVGVLAKPYDATIRAPYWGSRSELMEVLDLARTGLIHVETEAFTLDDAPEAYRRLHDGTLRGRAVVVP